MPAVEMSPEELLAELRQDPDFASLPEDWQTVIAEQVQTYGDGALQANASWAAENPDDPSSEALARWAQTGMQAVELANQPAVGMEEGLFDKVAPGLVEDIDADVGRRKKVDELTAETNAAFGQLKDVTKQADIGFDGGQYMRDNPDVAAAFTQEGAGMSADEYAKRHYELYGKNEGRPPAYTSEVLRGQVGAANQAAATQTAAAAQAAAAQTAAASAAAAAKLQALQQSITTMQAGLQGALAQQAAALAQNVATLEANLTTLDASQKQSLATQIAEQQANLEKAIEAQRAALQQQVTDLQGNATAAAAARRAALEQQIAQLTAAQAPVAEARIRGAEALTTAINLGLESTRDQLRADAAREGFVGPSSFSEAAQARAAIGARQDAARVGADARLQNAMDTRGIAEYGAGGRYSIEDAYAGDTQRIGDYGATGRAGLSSNLATGGQAIGDYGAMGRRTIADTTAGNRAAIGAYGAGETYGNANRGIWGNLDLTNAGAQGGYDIASALAQEQQNIAAARAKQEQDVANQTAAARLNYTNQLFPNAVNAAQIRTTLPGAQANALTGLIPYGTAGTRNALDLLQWWMSPNVAPPTPTAITTTPSQSGNQLANLGAGLVGGAFNVWPTTTTTKKKTSTTTNATTDASGFEP